MPDYIPPKDGDLRTWLNNYVTACNVHASVLNLTAADLAEISAAADLFGNSLDLKEQLAFQAKGATAAKRTARSSTVATVRQFAQEFQKNPNVTDAIRGDLGITIPDSNPSSTTPSVPTNLTAFGCSNGINQLRWNRNGNIGTTQFIIEARYGNDNNWQFVDVVTSSTYDHENQTPGEMVTYRVWAKRTDKRSGYSNEAVVYSVGSSSSLSIAA